MEDAVRGGPLPRLGGTGFDAERRAFHVGRPLGRGPVEEPRTDAGAEQHPHPAKVAVLRLGLPAEHPAAIAAEGQIGEKPERADAGPQVEDAERVGDPGVDGVDQARGSLRRQNHRQCGREQAQEADQKDRPIQDWLGAALFRRQLPRRYRGAPFGHGRSSRCPRQPTTQLVSRRQPLVRPRERLPPRPLEQAPHPTWQAGQRTAAPTPSTTHRRTTGGAA